MIKPRLDKNLLVKRKPGRRKGHRPGLLPGVRAKRRKLIQAIVEGKSKLEAALAAGYTSPSGSENTLRNSVYRELRQPGVREALARALDEAGCTIDASAEVIADAHRAKSVRSWCSPTGEVTEREYVDHVTRLKAADLAGKFRGVNSNEESPSGLNIGMLVQIVRKNAQDRGLPE